LRYDGQSGVFIDVFADGDEFSSPLDLAFGPNGNLYITNTGTNNIEYYDGQTGEYLGIFVHTGDAVTDIDYGPDGNLYAYEQTERILRYDGQSGDFIDVFVNVKAGDFVFGPDNDLYVSLASGYGVNHYEKQTGILIETLSGGICPFPTGLTFSVPVLPPSCGGKEPTIIGTADDDLIIGTDGDDVIVGLGGNDIIYGLGGKDRICGGDGDDVLYGGDRRDLLFGENGNDVLRGERGPDKLVGGSGNDTLDGGNGKDLLRGGGGNDTIAGGGGDDSLEGDDGIDVCDGGNHDAGDSADATCECIVDIDVLP
jgi:Ca2+-binding RTX toxin-like protein